MPFDNILPDNGEVHYEAGLRGSLCGCFESKRRGTTDKTRVSCPGCKSMIRRTKR
jgi:hypothetical protein